MSNSPHGRDFFAWVNKQAALLRSGKLSEVDIDHIAEGIESLGKAEKCELARRLEVLLMHLLKWPFQPERHGKDWMNTIHIQCGGL